MNCIPYTGVGFFLEVGTEKAYLSQDTFEKIEQFGAVVKF